MKGRAKFVSAAGTDRDESVVRLDYNTAGAVGQVRYGRYFVFYPGVEKWVYVDYQDIVWAYRRLEDIHRGPLHKTDGTEVHSIMLVTRDRKRIGIPVGEKENAVEGLRILNEKNPFIDIGYAKEKEQKYF